MPTPPASSATVDLTTSANFGTVDGAVFASFTVQPAGSGVFGTFVQIQGGATEQGYNTNFRPQQFDEHNSAPHNHALLLASVPIVEGDGTNGTVDGLLYREFLLDANEPNGQDRNFLSLDALQIYQANVGNLTSFHQPAQQGGNGTGFGANASLVYDLDAGGNNWIAVNARLSNGSGGSDARVLIPDALFDPNTPYVILYSAFGYQGASWQAQGGFEEWGSRGPQGNVPALNIAMTASVPGDTANVPGEVITYAITVRNMGNVSLTGVSVTDPSVSDLTRGADIVGNNDGVLNAGEIWSYTAHHTVTQADIDSGGDPEIVNTATADSNQTGPDSVSVSTPVERAAQLEIIKDSDVDFVDEAGDVIHYTISIENTGSTILTTPVVHDQVLVPLLDHAAPVINPNASFFTPVYDGDFNLGDTNQNNVRDPGETFQYYYPGDIDQNGFHDPGETWPAFNLGDTDQDGIHDAGETWVGDTNQNGIEELGERWQFQNLGDANHNGLQDNGETWQYANAGDLNLNGVEDAGETFLFWNIGDTDQDGAEDSGETFQFYNVGDTNQNGVEDDGETFQFTTVFQPLPGIDVDNNGFNDGDTNNDGIVDPGETWRYQGPAHIVTQAEIDNGGIVDPTLSIDNTADAQTDQTDPVTATASVHVVQNPHVEVDMTALIEDDADGRVDSADDDITYTITVFNDGNMTLHNVQVTALLGGTLSNPTGDANNNDLLDLGETWTYTTVYDVQQSDIDNGGLVDSGLTIDNTAEVDTDQTDPVTAAASVDVVQDPRVLVDMTALIPDGDHDGEIDSPDDDITYTITVFNDGNMTLDNVQVTTDIGGPVSGPSGDNGNGVLDLGETWTYTTVYDVQQSDIDNGGVVDALLSIDNTVEVVTDQTDPVTASASVDVDQQPSVTLDVAGTLNDGDNDRPDAGETISYAFAVTNSGNMTLFDVDVSDPDVTVSGTTIVSLAPGASDGTTFTGSYEIEQADIDAGSFTNEFDRHGERRCSGGLPRG